MIAGIYPIYPQSAVPGFRKLLPLSTADSSLASYHAVGDDGERLRVLVSLPAERNLLAADAKLAESVVGIAPSRLRRLPLDDLRRLLADVVFIALLDGDLDEEAAGLSFGADSAWFDSPRLVSRDQEVLVETDILGTPLEALPDNQREAAYYAAVEGWARALLTGNTLISSLRRDRLLLNGARLGLSRWAGARQPSPEATALINSLATASFATSSSVQDHAHAHLANSSPTASAWKARSTSSPHLYCLSSNRVVR